MGFEPGEAVGPFGVRASQPFVHGKEALELKSRRAALAVAAAADEAGPLQHLEMLGDGGLRQRGSRRKLDDTSLTSTEALEDRPASGVGKGGEGAAQGISSKPLPQGNITKQ